MACSKAATACSLVTIGIVGFASTLTAGAITRVVRSWSQSYQDDEHRRFLLVRVATRMRLADRMAQTAALSDAILAVVIDSTGREVGRVVN